jgi:flagellar motor component MotA
MIVIVGSIVVIGAVLGGFSMAGMQPSSHDVVASIPAATTTYGNTIPAA